MTFFERELRKIVEDQYPGATFVGRACYVKLGELNRAKLQFATCGVADQYEALQISILNRNEGQVDALRLRFADIWGRQKGLYAWTDRGETEWYSYRPTGEDYQKLTEAVSDYLEVFQEQAQTAEQQWQQTM